ncbi:MAG: hypothetical protein AB7O96_18830 [Pseudobdellovibrionaceae bacterium]
MTASFGVKNDNLFFIGIFSVLLSCLFFGFWSENVVKAEIFFAIGLLGLFLHSLFWVSNNYFQDHSKALLVSLGAFVGFSYLPFGKFFAVFLTFAIFGYFLSIRKKQVLNDKGLFLFAFIYAAFIFLGTAAGVGDVFASEKARQFALNPDTLFHASLSTMIKEFSLVSNGLHGLQAVRYHTFSHFLYARSSQLLGVGVLDIYGIANFVVFGSLLLVSLLHWISSFTANNKKWMHWILILGVLTHSLGVGDVNHFSSESYLIGLLLLTGVLILLQKIVASEGLSKSQILLCALYLPILFVTKISVGAVAFLAVAIAIYFQFAIPFWKRLVIGIFVSATSYLGYLRARIPPIKNLEPKFEWGWYQYKYAHDDHFVFFLLSQFYMFLILLPWFYFLYKENSLSKELRTWILIVLSACGLGIVGTNLTIDSAGYYFINVHLYMILPFFLLLLGETDSFWRSFWDTIKRHRGEAFLVLLVFALFVTVTKSLHSLISVALVGGVLFWKRNHIKAFFNNRSNRALYSQFVIFVLLLNGAYYCGKFLPKEIKKLVKTKQSVFEHLDYKNPYTAAFEAVSTDPGKKMAVYIPKTEKTFWENTHGQYSPWYRIQCSNLPFYTPVLTERPALFGLPIPAENCYLFHRGYESYSESEYTASAAPEIPEAEICAEALKKGFQGYYKISIDKGAEKVMCAPESKTE